MEHVVQVPQVDSWVPSRGHMVDPGLPEVLGPPVHPEHTQQLPGLGSQHVPPPSTLPPLPLDCRHLSCSPPACPLPLSQAPPSVTLSTSSQFPCFCVLHRQSPSLSVLIFFFVSCWFLHLCISSSLSLVFPSSLCLQPPPARQAPSVTCLLPNSPTDPTRPPCRALGPPADWSGGSAQSPPISCLAGPRSSRT